MVAKTCGSPYKSHKHELKANNRLIFTLTRIPQGAQKYIDDNCIYFLFSFFFLTIHGDIGVNETHILDNWIYLTLIPLFYFV